MYFKIRTWYYAMLCKYRPLPDKHVALVYHIYHDVIGITFGNYGPLSLKEISFNREVTDPEGHYLFNRDKRFVLFQSTLRNFDIDNPYLSVFNAIAKVYRFDRKQKETHRKHANLLDGILRELGYRAFDNEVYSYTITNVMPLSRIFSQGVKDVHFTFTL